MANRASGRADRASGADPFPWVVSLGCLLVGVGLFLHSTMPALEERRELELKEQEFETRLAKTEAEVRKDRRKIRAVGDDPEALVVEFDKRGLTPQQAIDEVARELEDPTPPEDAAATGR